MNSNDIRAKLLEAIEFGDFQTAELYLGALRSADPKFAKFEETRDFVVSFLHHEGKNRNLLTDEEWMQVVWPHADGFGPRIVDLTLLGDWSHVRDSSPKAVIAMAKAIREVTSSGS